MKTLFALPLVVIATVFVAAEQQTMQLPPRPAPMGAPSRDNGPAQPTKGTASLAGAVSSVDGGRVMRRASVRLQSTSSPLSRTTVTDDRGNFEFKELPAGDFTLRASKPGYLESIYGQKHPGNGRPGTPLSLKDGQRLEKIDVAIAKGGVLTGTIVDDIGEPMFGVPVRAMRYAMRNGERSLVSAGSTTTDDRGIYRIATLVPGDYIVMATPRPDIDQIVGRILRVEKAGRAVHPLIVDIVDPQFKRQFGARNTLYRRRQYKVTRMLMPSSAPPKESQPASSSASEEEDS